MSAEMIRIGSPQVISETMDGEAVVINLESGYYYSLDRVASEVWAMVEAGTTEAAVVAALAARYEAPDGEIERVLGSFIDEMERDGLIARVVSDGDSARPAAPAPDRAPFAPPSMTRFTDIKDLLLLDPIHEVDEAGWPNRKPDGGGE